MQLAEIYPHAVVTCEPLRNIEGTNSLPKKKKFKKIINLELTSHNCCMAKVSAVEQAEFFTAGKLSSIAALSELSAKYSFSIQLAIAAFRCTTPMSNGSI